MTSRLKIRSMVLPLATTAVLAAQLIDPSPVWKGLLTAFGGLWLLTYLWARSLQRNLHLERLMRFSWAQVGDRLEEEFTLRNDGWLPAVWLEISDESTLPGYSIAQGTGIEGYSQNTWRTSGTCSRRGVYVLGHTRFRTGDPLGIYEVEVRQPESATLTVMPPIIPLPFINPVAGGWQGEGRPREHAMDQTVSVTTVRPYVPGDSPRLMHWPTTARRNEPYVRMFDGEPASDWWIALDFEQRVQHGGEDGESTSELGVILAASLADRGLHAQRAVGLVASGLQPVWMRPEAGEKRRWEILRALATLEPGDTSLAVLLEGLSSALRAQTSLLVVTASTESDWLKPLARLFWRGISPTVILIDPASFGSEASAQPLDRLLTETGIAHSLVGRELFDRPEARPGPSGQWEWRVLPTGKAVPVRQPSDLSWKRLR